MCKKNLRRIVKWRQWQRNRNKCDDNGLKCGKQITQSFVNTKKTRNNAMKKEENTYPVNSDMVRLIQELSLPKKWRQPGIVLSFWSGPKRRLVRLTEGDSTWFLLVLGSRGKPLEQDTGLSTLQIFYSFGKKPFCLSNILPVREAIRKHCHQSRKIEVKLEGKNIYSVYHELGNAVNYPIFNFSDKLFA